MYLFHTICLILLIPSFSWAAELSKHQHSQEASAHSKSALFGNITLLANHAYHEKFKAFLQDTQGTDLMRLDHAHLFDFFLSYVDIPPTERQYIRRGLALDRNHMDLPRDAQKTWEPYGHAWALAATSQNNETLEFTQRQPMNIPILRSLSSEKSEEDHFAESLVAKFIDQKKYKEAQPIAQKLIEGQIEAYCAKYIDIGPIKIIKGALSRFTQCHADGKETTFLSQPLATHASYYLSLKDATKKLLEYCSQENKLSHTCNLLKTYEMIINGVSTYVLPYHRACKALQNKSTSPADLIAASHDFFAYCPGIPSIDHLRFSYERLLTAAYKADTLDLKFELYALGNQCARKLFYLMGDDATSNELFETFIRFHYAAQSFENSTAAHKECTNAAQYYFRRGAQALALDTALMGDDTLKLERKARQLEQLADQPNLKVLELKDFYYQKAIEIRLKKISLLPIVEIEEYIRLAELFVKRAFQEKRAPEKRALYQQALANFQEPVSSLDKEEPWDQPSKKDLDRKELATMYRRAAGLYYLVAYARYFVSTGLEVPHSTCGLTYAFGNEGNLPYQRERPNLLEESQPFFDEISQKQFFREAARCSMAMITKLGQDSTLDYLLFASDVLSTALDYIDAEDPLYEKCLASAHEYLTRRLARLGELTDQEEHHEAAARLFEISSRTRNQAFKGSVFLEGLEHHRRAFEMMKYPTAEDAARSLQDILSWSETQQRAPLPAAVQLPLCSEVSHMVKFLVGHFQQCTSPEMFTRILRRLETVEKRTDLAKPSFRTTYLLASYCYKAAWLSMSPDLICSYLVQAVRHLEELLTLLPGDTWPSYDHYHLISLTYEKAAQLNKDRARQKNLEGQARLYRERARQGLEAEQRLKSVGSDLYQYGNLLQPLTRQKNLPFFKEDYDSFKAFLSACIDRLSSLEIVVDSSGAVIIEQDDDSDEIPQEDTDALEAALCSSTPVELTLSDKLALSFQRKETIINRAHEYMLNTEKQEELWVSFLHHALDKPQETRAYLRKGTKLMLRDPLCLDKSWDQHFQDLMTLVFLEHPKACTVLADTLKQNPHAYGTAAGFLEPFFREEFFIKKEQYEEVAQLITQGQLAMGLSILNTYLIDPQQKKLLNELIEHNAKKRSVENDTPLEHKKDTREAQRQGLEKLAQFTLETAKGMDGSEKAQILFNASQYLLQRIGHTSESEFPSVEELQHAYEVHITARECPYTSESLQCMITKGAAQLSKQLVDFLGDDATAEQCKQAYNETIKEILDREKRLTGLIGTKYNEERETERSALFKLFKRARTYYRAGFERSRAQSIFDLQNEAQALYAQARSRNFMHGSVITCFLLNLASEYYKKWISSLGSHAAESQLADAAQAAIEGYQSAYLAHLPILRAEFLDTFVSLQEARLEMRKSLGQARCALLEASHALMNTMNLEKPADLFSKIEIIRRKALCLSDSKARYKVLVEACPPAWQLLEICSKQEAPDTQIPLRVHGKEISYPVSWIQKQMGLLALEVSKHAPTIEEKTTVIERCLKGLQISIPPTLAPERLSFLNWFEICKALLRQAIYKTPLSGFATPLASPAGTPAQSRKVTPLPSPFASQLPTPQLSPTASPREEEVLRSPRSPRTRLNQVLRLSRGSTSDLARRTLTSSLSPNASPRSPKESPGRSPRTIVVQQPRANQAAMAQRKSTTLRLSGELDKLLSQLVVKNHQEEEEQSK